MSKDEKTTSRLKTGLLKIGKVTAQNLWTVILDIVAVNLAYFMALIIRFYVQNQMTDEALLYFLPAYANFAPFYTAACIIVFILCRLYEEDGPDADGRREEPQQKGNAKSNEER